MRLTELLEEDGIIADLKARNKIGVLEELVEALKKLHPSVDKNALVKVLLERERLGSTGIGDGVAIPHGKFHAINHPVISFGRSRKGLDYESGLELTVELLERGDRGRCDEEQKCTIVEATRIAIVP